MTPYHSDLWCGDGWLPPGILAPPWKYLRLVNGTIRILRYFLTIEHLFDKAPVRGERKMTAANELINKITNFTPEQLEKFLSNPITQSILQPEEEVEPFPLKAS